MEMTGETNPKNSGFVQNIISGLATGLFSIPEGMAYAQLAGVNPIYGMYSGIVATIVASLSTGTMLMISTLTSAIALATGSVLQTAGIQDSQMPGAGGKVTLWANDKQMGEGRMPHSVAMLFTTYAGMDIGRDNGGVVDLNYEKKAPYAFTGAVKKVVFDLKPAHPDAEQELHEHSVIHAVAAGVAA
jgi:hypothetical protein